MSNCFSVMRLTGRKLICQIYFASFIRRALSTHQFTLQLLEITFVRNNFLERGSERQISLLWLEFFSHRQKWLLSWSQLQHHNVKNGFLVDHYIKKNEKNIEKISFVWFSHFDYLWRKYLWNFGVNKHFLTWLNLT